MNATKALLSECGQYRATHLERATYRITDIGGNVVCEKTTFWSNRSTNRRIRFVTGSGKLEFAFSFPRYPKGFYRRWLNISRMGFKDMPKVRGVVEDAGARVVCFWKADMNCWWCLGFTGTPSQRQKVDESLSALGLEYSCRQKRGMWDIEYPWEV